MAALCPAPTSAPVLLRDELESTFRVFLLALERACDEETGGMGEIEDLCQEELRELQRLAVERVSQKKADGADHSRCPVCKEKLSRVTGGHERTVTTRFGKILLRRSKGYCAKCEQWRFPADDLLGLDKHATASPSMQRLSAALVSKMPASEAARMLEELTGLSADDSTLAREARRQGERAEELRRKMDEEACDTTGRWEVTRREVDGEIGSRPFTLVIEMDAWMIRERDEWGRSEEVREEGKTISRWHWVYTATIFRLDQRGETQSGRPMILSRGYVATREGTESFSKQVYAEAVRQGLLRADDVLVIADGGPWIWNIAEDRFPRARKRLDFYHAAQHLHSLAAELFGPGTKEAREWAEHLIHQLKNGGEAGVLKTLDGLVEKVDESFREAAERVANYFRTHKDHIDYAAGAAAGEPIGSGAIESTCRQYQCRFKRPGQFWTQEGDEAILALETLWRNERWNVLFPRRGQEQAARS